MMAPPRRRFAPRPPVSNPTIPLEFGSDTHLPGNQGTALLLGAEKASNSHLRMMVNHASNGSKYLGRALRPRATRTASVTIYCSFKVYTVSGSAWRGLGGPPAPHELAKEAMRTLFEPVQQFCL